MSIKEMAIGCVVALALGVAGCSAQPDAHAAPPDQSEIRRLIPEKPFPVEARRILRDRMRDHAANMQLLMWSALVLDYEATRILAAKIGKSPRIKRPTPGTLDPLAASLPDAYFPLQDEMFKSVADVYRAAEARDDAALADSYGRLSTACISCHSAYIRVEPTACDRADRDQSYGHRPHN